MLSRDLSCLADQVEARARLRLPLSDQDLRAVAAALHEAAGRAAALERLPVPLESRAIPDERGVVVQLSMARKLAAAEGAP